MRCVTNITTRIVLPKIGTEDAAGGRFASNNNNKTKYAINILIPEGKIKMENALRQDILLYVLPNTGTEFAAGGRLPSNNNSNTKKAIKMDIPGKRQKQSYI